ncbi:related to CCW14 Secretory Stress Response protein 1 [Phialocephala subalpina]|uniref:Related to CCW14 Secretory Stress Response protein 1 n=1 Tax=Phialocephala subalpina TaxID=576137 RepID=A0A1L7X459_9HELO|nr:related to CCW14 Secretory Stress Response protein 1 [Phialocephala subalpina]
MKFAAAALVLASAAYSQTIADEVAMLPSCSLTCLQNAITGAGCSTTDYSCQCGSAKSTITTSATPCILGACSTNDALNVQSITNEICTLVAAGGASSSGGSSSTSSAPASSTSAASSASSATSSAASSATSASSSVASSVSSASSRVSSASSRASSATSSAASTTSSTPAVQTTGAASRLEAAGAVVGAAVLAAFAL